MSHDVAVMFIAPCALLTMSGHAPDSMAGGVVGDLLPDLNLNLNKIQVWGMCG